MTTVAIGKLLNNPCDSANGGQNCESRKMVAIGCRNSGANGDTIATFTFSP